MATSLQIEANRRNSLKSTGPRSPEGKAVSRFNALQSGIHAQAQVIPGEDPAELEALTHDYHEQFQPATALECFLVDSLIHADWQLRRLHRIEAQLWTAQISEAAGSESPLGDAYTRNLEAFTRLQRRIDSTERSYYRALTQLQRMQPVAPTVFSPEEVDKSPDLASFRHAACEAPLLPGEPFSSSVTTTSHHQTPRQTELSG